MATPGHNGDFHVLDEFVCDAIPAPGVPQGAPSHAGHNAGMLVLDELVTQVTPSAQGDDIDRMLLPVTAWPKDFRDLIALRLGGLSLPEISERLGTPPAVVAERLDRIVSRLGR